MKIASRITVLLLFLFVSTFSVLQAQPEHHHQGCHYASLHNKLEPLSEFEKNQILMNEQRSDTIDILNYAITLEVINFSAGTVKSSCDILFTPKMMNVQKVRFDLLDYMVTQVQIDGVGAIFDWDGRYLDIELANTYQPGDQITASIDYQGVPRVDDNGFGGLDFRDIYAYNLGIGLSSNPYNFGRSWFPCFDNFVERATYDISLITSSARKGYAIGKFIEETTLTNGKIKRDYRMDKLLPTYLVGIAISNYAESRKTHTGAYGDLETYLLGTPSQMTNMENSFQYLTDCIDALEFWFGPYVWEQVGFVATDVGAMEHSTLIAYPAFSAYGGPDMGQNRLMAHELGHHWWGNMISPNHPSDMWFKEGHAEYSAHLFTEYTFGEEAFREQVLGNHVNLITNLHKAEGYLALSGMTYENTYSDHTYYRGASMVHNLRGYLGDSLFRSGTTQFLQDNIYTATDAENYRDKLSAITGYDLTSYFDDWIFSPGYAGYEIDSIKTTPNGSDFDIEVFFEQGLRGATNYHTNCPLQVTFYDITGDEKATRTFMTNGQISSDVATIPFEPEFYRINEDYDLLLAQFSGHERVTETGNVSIPNTGFIFKVDQADQPSDMFVNTYWFKADDTVDPGSRTSDRRHWTISGQFPEGFNASASIFYNGGGPDDWEYDLVNETEDSLIVAYRPDASVEWIEYPFYTKNVLGDPNNGSGRIQIDSFLPGDYTFANGPIVNTTATEKPEVIDAAFDLFPNPSNGLVNISGYLEESSDLHFQLFDISGKLVDTWKEEANAGPYSFQKNFAQLETGIYLMSIQNKNGNTIGSRQFEIIR